MAILAAAGAILASAGAILAAAVLLTASLTVVESGAVLRSGCGDQDAAVAQLSPGDPVEIRFALAGESGACYKVTSNLHGLTAA